MAYPNSYENLGGWQGPAVTTVGGNATDSAGGLNAGIMGGLLGLFGKDGALGSKSLFGGVNANGTQSLGWAAPTLGIGQSLLDAYNGNKKLKLAEGQLKEGKRQFDLNYDAQKTTTNTQLEDRQRARVASNPGGYESVSSYLDKNRIK